MNDEIQKITIDVTGRRYSKVTAREKVKKYEKLNEDLQKITLYITSECYTEATISQKKKAT